MKKIFFLKCILSPISLVLSMNALALPHFPGVAHTPRVVKANSANLIPVGLSPQQTAIAYNFNKMGEGEGETIAIIDAYDAPTLENDLNVFINTFGLLPCYLQKIYATGTKPMVNLDWAAETTLDVEWAHAMAPKANILLVEAPDNSMDALLKAVGVATQHGATIVSMSWGSPEYPVEKSVDPLFFNPHIAFVASSGDAGHGVNYPAASPYVLGVGGTSLNIDPVTGAYINETAWPGSGGGISAYEKEPYYQKNFKIPQSKDKRGVPDVSYNADPSNGFAIFDSTPDSHGNVGWYVAGGTSVGAPQWAALIADAASSCFDISSIMPLIYFAAKKHYSKDFHDIQEGTNGTCGFYCTAQLGYDYVTGLGSPKASSLAYNLRYAFLSGALKN